MLNKMDYYNNLLPLAKRLCAGSLIKRVRVKNGCYSDYESEVTDYGVNVYMRYRRGLLGGEETFDILCVDAYWVDDTGYRIGILNEDDLNELTTEICDYIG